MKIREDILESIVKSAVDKLFENGQKQKAQRLILDLGGGRDGGGWCKQAVSDVISDAVRNA